VRTVTSTKYIDRNWVCDANAFGHSCVKQIHNPIMLIKVMIDFKCNLSRSYFNHTTDIKIHGASKFLNYIKIVLYRLYSRVNVISVLNCNSLF
jgi:hypothetical protein